MVSNKLVFNALSNASWNESILHVIRTTNRVCLFMYAESVAIYSYHYANQLIKKTLLHLSISFAVRQYPV